MFEPRRLSLLCEYDSDGEGDGSRFCNVTEEEPRLRLVAGNAEELFCVVEEYDETVVLSVAEYLRLVFGNLKEEERANDDDDDDGRILAPLLSSRLGIAIDCSIFLIEEVDGFDNEWDNEGF